MSGEVAQSGGKKQTGTRQGLRSLAVPWTALLTQDSLQGGRQEKGVRVCGLRLQRLVPYRKRGHGPTERPSTGDEMERRCGARVSAPLTASTPMRGVHGPSRSTGR